MLYTSFELISNNNRDKIWYNVPASNTDVILKFFLDDLEVKKKTRTKNIEKLKELYASSKELIDKIDSFIFRMPIE